jgi:glycosyltransferase 2 family protein
MKKSRAPFIFLLKAALGIGLLSIFLAGLDLPQFLRTFSSARPAYFVAAVLAYMAGKVITAARWAVLARPLGFSSPLKDFVVFYYIGMFFNLFTPSTLGGDAGRIFYLSREKSGAEQGRAEAAMLALISILADRAMGMAALVWIGAAALIAFPDYALLVPAPVRYATFVIAVIPILAYVSFPFGGRMLEKIRYPLAGKALALGGAYWRRPAALAQALLLSLVFHLIQIWIQILIAGALDFKLPWSYACVFFPLVDIVAMLPVSISGIGLREGTYLFFLSKLDVAPEKAVACGILWLGIVIASGLAGGLLFFLRRRAGQSESA